MTIFGICNLVPPRSPVTVAPVDENNENNGNNENNQQQHVDNNSESASVEGSSSTTPGHEAGTAEQQGDVDSTGFGNVVQQQQQQSLDDDVKHQIPHGLLSSFVNLTENDEDDDFSAGGKHLTQGNNTSMELAASNDRAMMAMALGGDHITDEGMHSMHDVDMDEEDDEWNLDGSGDSGHGLLSTAGGLGSGAMTPFSSRAHAAAAFGRLAKRAITFEDLIAAVDCFTAAYGQLETTEQRIVIARMYFLNRQLLYCQHDIIRQKQALAVAALQAKMIESGLIDANGNPILSSEAFNNNQQLMTSPENMGRPFYRTTTFSGPNSMSSFSSQFFRSMMTSAEQHLHSMPGYGGSTMHRHHGTSASSSHAMLNTPLAAYCNNASNTPNTGGGGGGMRTKIGVDLTMDPVMSSSSSIMSAHMTPSPILKPGMPLVTINTGANNGNNMNNMNTGNRIHKPFTTGMSHHHHHQQYHHPHHPQHQPQQNSFPFQLPQQQQQPQSQPVRLDAKDLLLQYPQTTHSGGKVNVPVLPKANINSQLRNDDHHDVGIQVCLSSDFVPTAGHRPKADVGLNMQQQHQQQNKGNNNQNNNRRQQQQQPSRGGRRTVVTWWPGVGDVGDEVMLPMPPAPVGMMMPPNSQQQQQQRRGQNSNNNNSNNRRPNNNNNNNANKPSGNANVHANWGSNFATASGRFISPISGDFGTAFFDDELKQVGGGSSYDGHAMAHQHQHEGFPQVYDPNVIERFLMAFNLQKASNPAAGGCLPVSGAVGGKSSTSDAAVAAGGSMCSSCQHRPAGQQTTNSQQGGNLSNRPVRRFDNCDIFDGDAPPQQAFA